MTAPACENCRFYNTREMEHGLLAQCYRFPPAALWGVVHSGDQSPVFTRPSVQADSWCGEFQASSPSKAAGGLPSKARARGK